MMFPIILNLSVVFSALCLQPYIDINKNEGDRYFLFDNQFPRHRVRRSELSNVGKKITQLGHDSAKRVEVGNEDDNSFTNVSAGFDTNFSKEENTSEPIYDNHVYYNSTYYPNGSVYFIDLADGDNVKAKHLTIKEHPRLSTQFKKAYKIPLAFSFPFYGSLVNNIVVTTGGFVNISPYYHSFIHLVHYVAPLMANFNPNKSDDSKVYIAFGRDVAIIQWDKMMLNSTTLSGKETFTFQIHLYKNGTIILAYKEVPKEIQRIKKTGPLNVTVGLSDGFILRYRHFDFKRKRMIYHNYVYSYHKVKLDMEKVKNNAAYRLDMLESCVQFKDCGSCLQKKKHFTCQWCDKIKLCSDTLDWNRQLWLVNKCPTSAVTSSEKCYAKEPSKPQFTKAKQTEENNNSGKVIGGVIGGILLTIILIVVAFFVYAYYHPQSKPGMWLIEHRPSRIFTTSFDKVPEEELL